MKFSDSDINVLKAIITDKLIGNDFAQSYDFNLFSRDIQKFAKYTVDYIKNYKVNPTKRVLCDKYSEDKNYIEEIWNRINKVHYDINEYPYDLDKLKTSFKEDNLLALARRISVQEEGVEPFNTDEAAKDIERTLQKIREISNGKNYIQRTLKEDLDIHKQEYEAKEKDPELGLGIMTGYSAIDYTTDGMKPAELMLICGSTGSGKSMVLANIAINAWLNKNTLSTNPKDFEKGYNILYFSLEMPWDRIRARVKAKLADIPSKKLLKASLTKEEKDRLEMANDFINNYPYEFQIIDCARNVTIEEIELRYLEAITKFKPDLVVIDYMNLMSLAQKGEFADWLQQSLIAGAVHEFSRVYNIPVLTAVQLTDPGKNKKDDKEADPENDVGNHRIGRSKLILHHVNNAIQLIKRRDENKFSNLLYQFIKVRDGENDLKGCMIKKLANAILLDTPFDPDGNSTGEDASTDISKNILSQQRTAVIINREDEDIEEDNSND